MTRGRYILLWTEGMKDTAMNCIGINYELTRLHEKMRRAASKGEYVIVMDRTDGTSLGAKCEPIDTTLIIRGIVDDGLVCRWNEANPDFAVGLNDHIVEVN